MPQTGGNRTRAARAGAFLAGLALGAGAVTGGALLLYVDEGFLPTFGFLAALVLAALAAGLWVSRPSTAFREPGASGLPVGWAGAIIAFLLAGIFAQLWDTVAWAREAILGRAMGVVFLLAEPAYATGALLAALQVRAGARRSGRTTAGGAGASALAGAAAGVAVAGMVLLPRVHPGTVFWAAAAGLMLAGLLERRVRSPAAEPGLSESTGGAEMDGIEGKVVIVTGVGARGQVGYAVAESFLELGARLAITDVGPAVEDLATELGQRGHVIGVRADLTRPDDADRVVADAVERFGRLDALVNVAGGLTVIKPVAETDRSQWLREWERNASTAFVMSRAALPRLRERGGAIVNFAAPSGLRAAAGLGAYSAAKAAVIALTRALALEEKAHGVRVNAIAPGLIDTEQNRRSLGADARGWVRRDEIATVAAFLVSDAASGISGETIHVMGEGLE